MKTLQVKHDTTSYRIPIWIEYRCIHCMDRGEIYVAGEGEDFEIIKCPHCTDIPEDNSPAGRMETRKLADEVSGELKD